MYLPVHTFFKSLLILVLAIATTGCGTMPGGDDNSTYRQLNNSFTIEKHVVPPQNIQSLQLFRKGDPSSPPIIRLNDDQRLVLEFDHLGSAATQFQITVRHFSKDWNESALNLNFYLDAFYEDYFGSGSKSYVQRPTYRHYEYEFPNDRLSFSVSGNYLLRITNPNTGELLFTLPFFVSENEGELQTSIKTEFARREDLREQDRPFSQYRYPKFVELPQFDLSYRYVQNQFWGRARPVNNFDTSTPGVVNFHLAQTEAFLGDYEFKTLDIRSFTAGGENILSFNPETIPPTLILRRDIQNLNPAPAFSRTSRFGLPTDDRSAEYANVQFKLETADRADSLQQIYLVGDFNGWSTNSLNRMKFDHSSGLWRGTAFVKQGEYTYKYVTIEKNKINDLALDRSFTYRNQEYITLVYFKDPVRHYDRLLKVERTVH